MSALRKALGEVPGEHRYIATVPSRGYRFVAEVRPSAARADDPPAEQPPQTARSATTAMSVKRLAPAAAVLLISGAGLWAWRAQVEHAPPRVLPVLPFRQLTAVPGDDYLGVGLADAVITRLSNVRELIVRPTGSVLKYAATVDARAAGRDLGVEAVLNGNVQHAGDRIRVTVQLLRVDDGRPVWAETFDESADDLFAIEDSVSERVTRTLAPRLAGTEKLELARHSTENIEAYRNYLRGRYAEFRFTSAGLNEAIQLFDRAIELDPTYALA